MYANITNPANFQLQDFAQFGFRVITTDFIPVPGEQYRTLYVLQDAVVTATTQKGDDITSKAILAGTLLHGLFNSVSITSGRVLAYAAGRVTAEEIIALYESYVSALGGAIENTQCAVDAINEEGVDLFADASLVMIPDGYGTGVVYGQRPLTSDSQLTFTRASDATRVGPDGAIAVVGSNVPRIDYTGGGCGKLLLEPQTTALNQFSEQLNNAYWVLNTDVTIEANTTDTLDPAGYYGADKVVETATTARHRLASNGTTASTVNHTASVFMKKGTARYGFVTFAAGTIYTIIVDLEDGTITATSTSGTIVAQKVEDYGNGWYRISVTGLSAVSGSTQYALQFGSAGSATPSYTSYIPSFAGSTSNYLYAWGANLTATSYLQSYIPTTAAAVTRLADACSKTGIASLIGQTQGTLFAEFNIEGDLNATRIVLIVSSVVADDFVVFFISGGLLYARMRATSVGALIDVTKSGLTSGVHKVAIGYAANDLTFYLDGVLVGQNTSASVAFTSPLSIINVGQNAAAINQLGDGVAQALLFKTRLSNEQLQTLTSL